MKTLFIIYLLTFLPQYSFAYMLSFENIEAKDISALKSNANLKIKKINMADVDNVIRELSKNKNYEKIYAYKINLKKIKVIAQRVRTISSIEFTGNKELSTSSLKNILNLQVDHRFDKLKISENLEALLKNYKENGFLKTKITYKLNKEKQSKISIIFNIIEGSPSRLKKINFNVNNDELKKQLKSITTKYLERTLSKNLETEIQETINNFLSKYRFLTAKINRPIVELNKDQTSATINYKISNSYKYEIIVEGQQDFSSLELYRQLNLSAFDRNKDPVIFVRDILKNFYLGNGYANVQIKTKEKINKAKNQFWLSVKIKEGPKVRISSFDVRGRISKPQKYYINFIRNNSTELINRMFFSLEDLDLGISNLLTHLQNTGFLKVKKSSLRIEKNKSGSEVKIILYLDEGPLTIINKIQFSGNRNLDSTELLNVLNMRKGAALNSEKLNEGLENLKNLYLNNSYIEMKILNTGSELVKYDDTGSVADILIKIYEGPKVFVKSILIEGNTFTKNHVILTEIPLAPGDLITPQLIELTKSRLNNLGIFNLVQVSTLERDSKITGRTLMISVLERDPGLFRLGLGVTDEYKLTYRGFIGLSYNNIGGDARSASIRADLLRPVKIKDLQTFKVNIGYLEPFLWKSRTRGTVNVKRHQLLSNIEDDDANVTVSNSVSFGLDRDITQYTNISWNLLTLSDDESFTVKSQGGKNSIQVGTLGPIFTFDNRDSPFLPTKGNFARFLIEYSSPNIGSTEGVEFYKTDLSFSHYFNIPNSNNVILAVNLRGGLLENLSSLPGSGVPYKYAFALGGRSTIRGFDASSKEDKLLPESELSTAGTNINSYIQNSQSYQLLKTELRFTFYENYGGVLFYDAGALYAKGVEQAKPFRQTAGFGFRYNTPFGPVNFEFGFKLGKLVNPEEDKFKFHFSIGVF